MRIILVIPLCLLFSGLISGAQTASIEGRFAVQPESMQISGALIPPQINEPEKPLFLHPSMFMTC